MSSFYNHLQKVLFEADVILEVIDARFPDIMRNYGIERHVKQKGKELILVLNKSDLISKSRSEKLKQELSKEFNCVFISTKKHAGLNRLKAFLSMQTKKFNRSIKVGIVGFPNAGKSSLINSIIHRRSAKTSAQAGYTKGEQLIRLSESIYFLDSPGIIPFNEEDFFKLMLVNAKSVNQLRDIEDLALSLIEFIQARNPIVLRKFYSFKKETTDADDVLAEIAIAKNRLLKQGRPDLIAASRILISDWQVGKIRL